MTIESAATPAAEFWPARRRDLAFILPGSTDLHNAFQALAWRTVNKRRLSPALIWGWVGVGKTLFAESLQQALIYAGLEYSLVRVDCSRLLCDSNRDTDLPKLLSAATHEARPLLVAINQVEILTRSSDGALGTVAAWLNNVLSKTSDENGLLLIATTSRPDLLDPFVKASLRYRAYYDLPDEKVATELLENQGVPDPKGVAAELMHIAQNLDIQFTARGLLAAVRLWKLRPQPQDSSVRAAEWIAAASTGAAVGDIEKFREQNQSLLDDSRDFLEVWTRKYQRHFDENGRLLEDHHAAMTP